MKKIVRRSGFTLPEVLVTVTVVAVLAAVVVPAVTQYVGRGNGPATQTDLTQIQNAVTAFVTDTKQYPTNLTDLTGGIAPGWLTTAGYGGLYHGPYLQATVTAGTVGSTGQGLGASGTQALGGVGAASFTSQGEGLAFADTILNSGGYLSLVVLTPTTCTFLANIDKAIDDNSPTTGNLTYDTPCTTNGTTVRYKIATIGQ